MSSSRKSAAKPAEKNSLLGEISSCIRLRQGGEANVYLLCMNDGSRKTLKWYGTSFNDALVSAVEKINEPGICRIREHGIHELSPYQLYDFVEGLTSENLPKIPGAIAVKALRQVVSSLRTALKGGASHGDLNPANVIFSPKENRGFLDFQTVLIDWGIVGPGTLAYAAPERFLGKGPDEKSDIFSLGMLLFRWMTGENLVEAKNFDEFAAQNAQINVKNISERLYLQTNLNPAEISALESIWEKTLSADPDLRTDDLEELDELLEIALDEMSGGEVALTSLTKNFVEGFLPQWREVEQKLSLELKQSDNSVCPVKKTSPQNAQSRLKIAILGGVGLFLVAIAFLVAVGTEHPDVDETGEMILKNSRDLYLMDDSIVERNVHDSLPVEELLKELPTPP